LLRTPINLNQPRRHHEALLQLYRGICHVRHDGIGMRQGGGGRATQKWAETFVSDDPDPILALYAKDAVLWGTLSPVRRDDPAALRDYFVKAFAALPGHKVSFGDQLIRVYGTRL
jgi:hypothetical protein